MSVSQTLADAQQSSLLTRSNFRKMRDKWAKKRMRRLRRKRRAMRARSKDLDEVE
ncbi:hypothetical protein WALSEDRAFT_66109 [Wallemia mellicola CBS 633.66]|uniref:60S ribosomal protein L41 n=1 Tax=Wallemia mellicola (strain ATCC MYA-4683 / CBS 633.66) TaxID=671144 RepID=I4Y714_WALMC|nr:hypothetical protein WALSEDRAFT_66109 [Wallemia mellicola CBS 633.66]EIM19756.1 hypothetical protein WALSEDRAFT_66109 [Wallemia mellicola CBS 633.66]|eukprot:XP_006960264.1 hypothetical protein WALSEDRAFT_66109 [Wallemia mellicola CBS 633.66]